MNEFNFGRPVKICGEVYYLTSNMKELSEKMSKIGERCNQMKKEETSDDEKMSELTGSMQECIDFALGKGSFDCIFSVQPPSALNMMSLVQFITSEINAWRKEIAKTSRARKKQ